MNNSIQKIRKKKAERKEMRKQFITQLLQNERK